MLSTELAAGILHRENTWLQMLSESQDFVQGTECRERRTKTGGETGIQMMAHRFFRCQLKYPLNLKHFGVLEWCWLADGASDEKPLSWGDPAEAAGAEPTPGPVEGAGSMLV